MSEDEWNRRKLDTERWDRLETRVAVTMNTIEVIRSTLDKMERITDERLGKLHEQLEDLDDAYRGGPGAAGLEERLREIEAFRQETISLLRDGPLKPGLISRLGALETGLEDKRIRVQDRSSFRTFMAAIIGAFLALAGTLLPKLLHMLNNPPPIEVPHHAHR